jgi:hypothetical protein
MLTSSESGPGLRKTRKGFFAHLLEALHHSRRRNAIRVLRRYHHLIAEETQIDPASYLPQSRPTEKSSRNADRNSTLVHAIHQARRKVGREFA